jgi:hypothetical protein
VAELIAAGNNLTSFYTPACKAPSLMRLRAALTRCGGTP